MKEIKINGPIVDSEEKWIYDLFDIEATSAQDVAKQLPESGEDVEITINSYGGYVDQGSEIYTLLRSHPGQIAVNVINAYSAASVIAMAGNPVRISPIGRVMIHNASALSEGDYNAMDKMSERLQHVNKSMCSAYALKTGKSQDEILSVMENETWLTADEAVEQGYADEVMFSSEEKHKMVASSDNSMIPKDAIDKLTNAMKPKFNLDELADKVADKLKDSSYTLEVDSEKLSKQLGKTNKQTKEPEAKKTGFARFFF